MRLLLFFGIVAVLGGARALADSAASPGTLDGSWVGIYERGAAGAEFLFLRVDASRSPIHVVVSLRRERILREAANNIVVDDDRLAFDLVTKTENRHFDLRRDGDRLEGRVEEHAQQGHFTVHLKRLLKLTLDEFKPFVGNYRTTDGDVFFVAYDGHPENGDNPLRFYATLGDRLTQIFPDGKGTFVSDSGAHLTFDRIASGTASRLRWDVSDKTPRAADRVVFWREEAIAFDGSGARLAGTLYVPMTQGPLAALVFVHGSGPQERLAFWSMADRFARAGITCLSYDKRGTGKSTGDWHQAGFDVLADDVIAAVDALRARPNIRRDQIGLWGVSQAGWIIPLAASRSDHVGFLIPVSGGAVSPAEQELWRRTQNLRFFGCGAVLCEAMRRGVAMHYQWEELFKTGRFPVPPLFEAEPLNMYHDAPAVIRAVRQPTLAIFGELDRLTPPKESAAIWVRELEAAGNRDYSVRIFPRATHGLLETDGTGNPFDPMPESRLAPGYLKTMIDWINDRGRTTRAAHNVLDAGPADVIESRGLPAVPWYGSAPVQVSLLITCTLGSVLTLVGWPMAWMVRKLRKRTSPAPRGPIVMGWIVDSFALAMCVATLAILRMLGDATPNAYYGWVLADLWILSALTVAIGAFAVALVRAGIREFGDKRLSRASRALYWVSAATACLWVPFFVYWTWGPLFSS